jgi:hypothetical protein
MGLVASFAAIVAVLVHVSWAPADPLIGPTPATPNAQLSVTTSTNNVADGAAIHFTVTTSGGATLNLVEAHICVHGFTSYTLTNFNFSGPTGLRCVYANGITTGGLNSVQSNYKLGPLPFSAVTTSGDQSFAVGSGAVSWFGSDGFGPASLTCGPTSECDLVVRVGLTGDPTSVLDTFFIQPICFAGGSCGTATTTTTTGGTTSTTGGTTSTTAATTTTTGATTTTKAGTTTTTGTPTTLVDSTTTTTGGGGSGSGTPTTLAGVVAGGSGSSPTGSSGSGSLAFTGSTTRNLVSIALLLVALGLFLLGQASRRRGASTR